jgi:hypothetical protein
MKLAGANKNYKNKLFTLQMNWFSLYMVQFWHQQIKSVESINKNYNPNYKHKNKMS